MTIERAGLYSLSGPNNVLAICNGGYVGLHPGNGAAPFNAAFAATAGRTDCIFTASPEALPVFDRPYSGAHTDATAQSFNHDVFNIGLDVTAFAATPISGHLLAHWIDLNGVQKCDGPGEPADGGGADPPFRRRQRAGGRYPRRQQPRRACGHCGARRLGGAALCACVTRRSATIRISARSSSVTRSASAATANSSRPTTRTSTRRWCAAATSSPPAHIGPVGHTGATAPAGAEHLHMGTWRNTNLSFRASWEHGYAHVGFDQDKNVAATDPFGWRGAAATDPWAWRFRAHDLAGCWSINLWQAGEAPTMD